MLKSILKVKGVTEIKKQDQSKINGGGPCFNFHFMCITAENYNECMDAFLCFDYQPPTIIETTSTSGVPVTIIVGNTDD